MFQSGLLQRSHSLIESDSAHGSVSRVGRVVTQSIRGNAAILKLKYTENNAADFTIESLRFTCRIMGGESHVVMWSFLNQAISSWDVFSVALFPARTSTATCSGPDSWNSEERVYCSLNNFDTARWMPGPRGIYCGYTARCVDLCATCHRPADQDPSAPRPRC